MKKESTGTNPTAIDFISTQPTTKDFIGFKETVSAKAKSDHSLMILSSVLSKKNKSKKLIVTAAALIAAIGISSVALISNKNSVANKQSTITNAQATDTTEKETATAIIKDDKAKTTRKNWQQLITAQNSNYGYGVLGGINNLSVIFTNRTDYPLEEVTAKIIYLKANGKPWKTKYISVFNMAPHSERKQSLAKVNRGKSVQIAISKIVSKTMHFNYTVEKKKNNVDDPYYMD